MIKKCEHLGCGGQVFDLDQDGELRCLQGGHPYQPVQNQPILDKVIRIERKGTVLFNDGKYSFVQRIIEQMV